MVLLIVAIFAAIGLATWLRPWPLFPGGKPTLLETELNVAVEFRQWVERQARVRGLNVRGVARPVRLECPKCRKTSNYFVYPDELCERCWRAQLKTDSTHASENRA